ncbi:hypothetical protein V6N13_048114 [Hibiscus sabdariffa]|uniref:Uncharacterized protein n=1 Tax=Hibiscus sabdariffa TaxID=183260 RepID=A0ABR2F687_9ROSI
MLILNRASLFKGGLWDQVALAVSSCVRGGGLLQQAPISCCRSGRFEQGGQSPVPKAIACHLTFVGSNVWPSLIAAVGLVDSCGNQRLATGGC